VSDERQRSGRKLDSTESSVGKTAKVVQEARIVIQSDLDIVEARQQGRTMASQLGFTSSELTLVATAISELARNIVAYASRGEIALKLINHSERQGIVVIASDEGPGIRDVSLALQDGYSTSRSLGMGLPGVRRLMDEFDIETTLGQGTKVTVKKWTNA
jgi:serine/threonine-protein kinase RsbT